MTEPVAVRGLTGKAYELQPDQVAGALEAGAKPITPQEASGSHQAWQQMKALDANWSAPERAAAGVFNGLTLGLGPAGVAALGLDKHPEENEALHGSGAFMAGDIAGMLAPALLSGGETAAARGALEGGEGLLGRALGWTPAGLMGRAGTEAEAMAGRLLPEVGTLGKVGRSTLQMAARGSTEGSIVNLAHTVSDSYIQDKPLTAQSLAASGVNGALFGGLAGGILGAASGTAGAAFDSVGGSVLGAAAGRGEAGAATALKRIGATEKDLARMAGEEGGLVGAVRKYHDILEKGDASFASNSGTIGKTIKETQAGYEAGIQDAVKTLDAEAASQLPNSVRVESRLKEDLKNKYAGTFLQNDAIQVGHEVGDMFKSLESKPTWKNWVGSRAHLSDLADASRSEVQKDVYRTALNAMDSEIASAMDTAGLNIGKDSIGEQFRAAVMGKKMSQEMGGMMESKIARELGGNDGSLRPQDMGTMAWGTLMGHPVGAAGIVAAKGIYRTLERKLEPAMAEAAYRNAVGAQAAKATQAVGNRVTSTLKKFMGLGGRVTAMATDTSDRPKYDVKSFKKTMELSDKLTSQVHAAKVQELVSAMSQMGHADLAEEMAAQYKRAVDYLNFNAPKSAKMKSAGSLSKQPERMGLDSKEMKYMQIFSALSNPMSIVDGVLDGSTSRVAVNAVSYVLPEWHTDIVARASNIILESKEKGEYQPADKVALLGVLLNAPVDTTLEKPFIDEIQKAHQANGQPQPPPGQGAPQPQGPQLQLAQTSDYKTPMQNSLG